MTTLHALPRLTGPTRVRPRGSVSPTSWDPSELGVAGVGAVQRAADAGIWLVFRLSGVRS